MVSACSSRRTLLINSPEILSHPTKITLKKNNYICSLITVSSFFSYYTKFNNKSVSLPREAIIWYDKKLQTTSTIVSQEGIKVLQKTFSSFFFTNSKLSKIDELILLLPNSHINRKSRKYHFQSNIKKKKKKDLGCIESNKRTSLKINVTHRLTIDEPVKTFTVTRGNEDTDLSPKWCSLLGNQRPDIWWRWSRRPQRRSSPSGVRGAGRKCWDEPNGVPSPSGSPLCTGTPLRPPREPRWCSRAISRPRAPSHTAQS